jgi:exodeoxyribonuclease VII large subunit
MRALVRALPLGDALLATPRQRADRAGEKLRASLSASLGKRHLNLAQASRLLARHAPQAELSRATGRLNTLVFRLDSARKSLIERRRERLDGLVKSFGAAQAARLNALRAEVRARGERRQVLSARLDAAMAALLKRRREKLEHLEQMRFALGYGAILQRGFALVRNDEGVVRSALEAPAGTRLSVQFFDGRIAAIAGDSLDETATAAKPVAKRREATPKKKPEGGQGSLF